MSDQATLNTRPSEPGRQYPCPSDGPGPVASGQVPGAREEASAGNQGVVVRQGPRDRERPSEEGAGALSTVEPAAAEHSRSLTGRQVISGAEAGRCLAPAGSALPGERRGLLGGVAVPGARTSLEPADRQASAPNTPHEDDGPSAVPAAPPAHERAPLRAADAAEHTADGPRGSQAPTEQGVLRFVALGDSLTEGVGDPVPGGWRGWAELLAAGLAEEPVDFRNLAQSGAQSREVMEEQLPQARALRPHLAAVLVGVNDTLRASYDIAAITARLDAVLAALVSDGTVVLTACLPDPGQMLRLPQPLARPLARRMASVNTVVHALSERYGAIHVHAAHEAWVGDRSMWSVDRLHPSERGHRALARAFHEALAGQGLAVGEPVGPEPRNPAPARSARAWWMATKGTAWVRQRCHDLLPDLVRLALTERRHQGPELLDHRAARDTALALAALPGASAPAEEAQEA